MPRSRSRSRRSRPRDRSRGRGDDRRHNDDRRDDRKDVKDSVAEAAKSGNSEQEIVSVAIRQLPQDIRERLEKLFEEGLLKEGDLDLRSITVFASLNEGLQARVMNHMEGERIYVANARSKSGFLIATCDKAKTGCLDARGLGAIDPWRTALVAMATPKQKMIDLKPEAEWLEKHEEAGAIKIHVAVQAVEKELGVPSVTVELPLTETSAAVKAKLVAMGVRSIPANRMKLHADPVGFLKDDRSFAFYNFVDGVTLSLSERKRAGTSFRKDHTQMPKRPRTQPAPGEAPAAQVDALKSLVAGAKLPSLPALPKLPGLPGVASAGSTAPAGLPGLPGLSMPLPGTGSGGPGARPPPLTGLPGLLPSLPGLPGGLAKAAAGLTGPGVLPGLSGLPGLGASMPMPGGLGPSGSDPKANAISAMLSDLAKGKALPGLPPPGADPKVAALAMLMGTKPPHLESKAPGLMPMAMDAKGMPPMPSMSMSMPSFAGLAKAAGAGDQVPTKAQMPDMSGAIPKLFPGAAGGAAPRGATPKGGAAVGS